MLTERQTAILRIVVDSYVESGRPVASAMIAERGDVAWGPSTVRSELAALEREGFLGHPHTSSGRVPTDAGYRCYADRLLRAPVRADQAPVALELGQIRREVDEAMRETTAALARANDLMALVTAPPTSTERIHRVEVLALQPRVVAVVVIASNGAVSKRVFSFERPLDPGLVEWAASYLQERLGGLSFGSSTIGSRLRDRELGAAERDLLGSLASAFTDLDSSATEALYVDGTARLLSDDRAAEFPDAEALIGALERRADLLRLLRSAVDERSVYVWIGAEIPEPDMQTVALVGANYGLGYRNLGAVSIVGPRRMDYGRAIASVRVAAIELSHFFETIYEG